MRCGVHKQVSVSCWHAEGAIPGVNMQHRIVARHRHQIVTTSRFPMPPSKVPITCDISEQVEYEFEGTPKVLNVRINWHVKRPTNKKAGRRAVQSQAGEGLARRREQIECTQLQMSGSARTAGSVVVFARFTPVAGPIFENKNRAIFLERFFGRGISGESLLPLQLCSH